MSLYSLLYVIYFSLTYKRLDLLTVKLYLRLIKSDRCKRSELQQLRSEKLNKLLIYVNESIPYYKRSEYSFWDASGDVEGMLKNLPVLTKEDIRKADSDIVNKKIKNIALSKTGGTTGKPLKIWKNRYSVSIAEAALWRGKLWHGVSPWQPSLIIKGLSKIKWYAKIRMMILRKKHIEAFRVESSACKDVQGYINKRKGVVLEGYVTELLSILEKYDFSYSNIKAVFTTGEMLYLSQKDYMNRKFNAPVVSYYGSNEIGGLAFECEKRKLHITEEHVIIEVVNEYGQPVWDEPGRILVTDLDNYAMPLIRYEIGDIGIISKRMCSCGRETVIIKKLMGRTQDVLLNKAGDKISATFLAGRFRNLKYIKEIQFVQSDYDKVAVLYVSDSVRVSVELKEIKAEIYKRLGEEMKIELKKIDQIPITERGKKLLVKGIKIHNK